MRIASRPFVLWISAASASTFSSRSFGLSTRLSSTLAPSTAFLLKSSSSSSRHYSTNSRAISASQQLQQLRMASSTTESDDKQSNLRVALCQFHVTNDKEENHKTANKHLSEAADKGAKLVVLPEIWNSPYATAAFPEYAEILPNIGDTSSSMKSSQLLIDAAKQHNMWIIGGSIPEKVKEESDGEEKIYNTCLVINPNGEIVAKHRKVHLFDIDVPGGITFFESETLTGGDTVSHFTTPYGEIGVGICYDIRFPEYAMILRQNYNCCILIYPGAFNMTTGPAHWELLQRARALDNQCFVITAAPARTTVTEEEEKEMKYPHYTAWGHSTVTSPWGDIVATTDEKEGIIVADLDLSKIEEVRSGIPISYQKRLDMYKLDETEK